MSSRWSSSSSVRGGTLALLTAASDPATRSALISLRVRCTKAPSPMRVGIRASFVTLGQTSVIKVITNMLAFIHLVADGEALMLARRGGVDLKLAWDVIKASSGNSFVHETEGQLILNGSYNINFTMDLARKDLYFAHQMGREFGVPLELAGLTEQIFARAMTIGDAQSPMVIKMLEEAVGTDLRAPGFPAELDP